MMPAHPRPSRFADAITLSALSAVAMILTSTANRLSGNSFLAYAPRLAWLATAAVPSCIAIAVVFFATCDARVLGLPKSSGRDRAYVGRVAAIWLGAWTAGLLAAAALAGHWITYARGWPAILAFLLFGPLGEELLFRGAIHERARRLWSASARPAILVSATAFSLHHLQLHPFPPRGLARAQLVFTFPFGLVLGALRERTGSIWPGFLLHVLTNLPAAF